MKREIISWFGVFRGTFATLVFLFGLLVLVFFYDLFINRFENFISIKQEALAFLAGMKNAWPILAISTMSFFLILGSLKSIRHIFDPDSLRQDKILYVLFIVTNAVLLVFLIMYLRHK